MTKHRRRKAELHQQFNDDPAGFFRVFAAAVRRMAGRLDHPTTTQIGKMIDFIIASEESSQTVPTPPKTSSPYKVNLYLPGRCSIVC